MPLHDARRLEGRTNHFNILARKDRIGRSRGRWGHTDGRLAVTALMAVVLLVTPAASAGTGGDVRCEDAGGPPHSDSAGTGIDGLQEISFELLFPYQEMAKVMYIHRGETKKASLTVRNNGSFPGTVELGIAIKARDNRDWKANISVSSLHLMPGQSGALTLTVTGPSTGIPNEYIEINISMTSGNDPSIIGCKNVKSYLVTHGRRGLQCPDHVHTTLAGVPTQYSMLLFSDGDIDEEWNLTCNGPPGWEYKVEPANPKTKPLAQSVNITLTVTPPLSAEMDEVGVVSVIARTRAQPSVKDTITTHTVVSGMMLLELGCPDSEKFAHPGTMVAFNLLVSNFGNLAGEANVTLEIDSLSTPCSAWLEQDLVVLAGGDTLRVGFKLAVPGDAAPGTRIVARVVAKDREE